MVATLGIADICEDGTKLKKKFNNDFVRVVQDAAGFRGEFILHGRIFPLKLVSNYDDNDDDDEEYNHDSKKSPSNLMKITKCRSNEANDQKLDSKAISSSLADCMSPIMHMPSVSGSDSEFPVFPPSFFFKPLVNIANCNELIGTL